MLTSIATVSLSGDLAQKLEAIADAGFNGVEIFENDLIAFDGLPVEIGLLLRDLGLTCTCYQPFRDFEGLQGAARTHAFDRAERKFDLMGALGAELMLVCSSVSPEGDGSIDRIADDFHTLGERAAKRALKVGYEALAWGRHIYDHRQSWEVVRRAGHPSVGLILDSFHSLSRHIPVESLYDIAPEKIFLVQLADAPKTEMDYLYWSRHFRCFPGQGDLPVTDYVRILREIGYAGNFSLEIFNDRFRSWSPGQIAEDGRRSLLYLDEQTKPAVEAPAMPPRAITSGFAFIEFAADGHDAGMFARIFAAMGFRLAGRHRRKAVERWQQGDISFILNREDQGFASSHRLLHGPSVCAMGIRVDDVAATMARANGLHMHTFAQAVGPGEIELPSIRGVGGALIYFTPAATGESFWAQDFTPIEGAGDAPEADLKRIDHIAQSMRVEEFLSWVLYYTSLLDVATTPPVDVADPLGLVLSQAVESPDGLLRVTLNGASGQTLASRFVDAYLGAGVQHIACETGDIFQAAAHMAACGVPILPVPANYYDDAQARFQLHYEFVLKLKSLNIFYDRDNEGEYFQFYTRAIDRRVFFEIVQRQHYRAYGAANTLFVLLCRRIIRMMGRLKINDQEKLGFSVLQRLHRIGRKGLLAPMSRRKHISE